MTGEMFSFEINRTTSAPSATLFRLETDGVRWSEWAKPRIIQTNWEQEGDPVPAGVGAVRKVGLLHTRAMQRWHCIGRSHGTAPTAVSRSTSALSVSGMSDSMSGITLRPET